MSNKPPVLVVDDNAAKRLALRAVLMPLGFPVVQADCGLAALRCVMAQDFAVILLDVCMPTMDGFETAALIRQRRQSEMTPIIFITAFGGDELAYSNRYAQGAVDFIFAPVEPEELRAKVTVFANLFSQSADLVTQAHQAQTSADQLRLLTEAAPIGIFQTDIANRYVYTNPRWSEITGIAAADASGRDWDAVIGSQGSLATQLAESVRDGAEFSHRFEIPQVAGTPRTVVMTSVSIPDSEGAVSGWVGTLLDVTAEAEAEAAISRARDEAKNASQLKSDFLANMSHEIRTPMNGIIGMTDLLLETVLDARQRDYAQTVRSSGEALLGIIDDILDFSKIEAGHLEMENIDYDPVSIVDGVLDLLAGGAQAKGLELVAVAEGRPPTVVKGDPGRVRQVLTNLVGNSIKFTTAGEVIVRIAAVEALAGTAVLRFEVSDTGDGIAADKLEAIFQSFVQADTSTSRKYGGTGLGLSISRELVTLMGGEFGVASELGTGSTFWFTIRVQLPVEPSMHAVTSADSGLIGVRVLVVDDNATVRNVLVQWLTEWGVSASAVGAGAAGLTALTAANAAGTPFAVVIVDQSKVPMDGLALKDAILADPAVTAALIVMTGLGHEAALDAEARSGVLTLLSKPVHRESLRSCLRAAVGLAEPEPVRRAARAGRDVGLGPSTGGRLLLVEDNLVNQKVALAMLANAGYHVDTALNGAAAVSAAAQQHYDAVLMDCQMPEMNGYEATAAIRAQEGAGRHTPIIAVTAGARPEDRERCLAEGMDAYIAKPLNKRDLLDLVARSLNSSPTLPSSAAAVPLTLVADSTLDPEVFDELELLSERVGGDFLGNLIAEFVNDTELRLSELREAVTTGDRASVARIAHTISGSGGQLAGGRFARACGRLEARAGHDQISSELADLDDLETEYRELRSALAQRLSRQARRNRRAARG